MYILGLDVTSRRGRGGEGGGSEERRSRGQVSVG